LNYSPGIGRHNAIRRRITGSHVFRNRTTDVLENPGREIHLTRLCGFMSSFGI